MREVRGLRGELGACGIREGSWGEGCCLSKIHNMFAIIQNIFSFTHKKYSCVHLRFMSVELTL